MNAANNGILKRLLGNQNLTVSFSEEETGDIKANVFSLINPALNRKSEAV